ncbi:unnamed protein product [Haemonchus placei]|uniref:IBR domain-containing protein n=1 Tax=Haemonchus placei TaxID=6290 RepID=A0A0N4VYM1_HAEPC|nr:unnamed protein product [Haemonchus placei]
MPFHRSMVMKGDQYWIRDKAKARIKCVKPICPTRIHENDINAVLDEQEDGLNLFMPLDHRQWLQYYHNKDVIYYACGGNEYVKQCPLCKSMYVEKEGCSFVRCANLRCRTRFCWQCGDPIESIMHFTGGSSVFHPPAVFRWLRQKRKYFPGNHWLSVGGVQRGGVSQHSPSLVGALTEVFVSSASRLIPLLNISYYI